MRGGVILGLVLVAGLMVGGLSLLAAEVRDPQDGQRPDERLYLPDGELLRHASLGWHAPLADYTWLQATQYYGGYHQGEHDFRYFDGLVEATILLDPRFVEAYVFAGLAHCFDSRDYQAAIDIMKRGLVANPDSWRLPFEIGFVHYVFTREFDRASMWFASAAERPGASDFCRRFAAWSASRAGDAQEALLLWENLRRTTGSEEMRELATRQIEKLTSGTGGEPRPGQTGPPAPANPGGRL
jgi:hypothetical protein